MPLIDEIRKKVATDEFELSKHAVDQSIIRRIRMSEMREAISNGEVIEDYPEDKYGPSCLIHGKTAGGRAIHVQCSHPSRQVIRVITVYEPDPERWIDFKVRRST